jgi:hypothetical protein
VVTVVESSEISTMGLQKYIFKMCKMEEKLIDHMARMGHMRNA